MGKLVRDSQAKGKEAGTALGGGGDMSTRHIVNFFNAVRGTEKQNSTIADGVRSTLLSHLANISYRTGKFLKTDPENGHIQDQQAMKLWARAYEPGWEPKI